MDENLTSYVSDILDKDFLKKYSTKKVPWKNGLSYIVYKRTYSRTKEDGSTEEFWETLARVINGAQKIGAQYTKAEAQRLYDYMFNLKCLFGGRMLWQLGTPLVDRFCGNSLIACFYTNISSVEDFCFLFENLMLGGGVGYSVRREHVHELPKIKPDVIIINKDTKDADFIVPDSREGWVELLRKTLDAFFYTGKGFSYSTILVRGYGEPIKTFGGTASGPKILVDGINKICDVLSARENKKIRSIDALDVCNIIGGIVVSGNVRRSAQIALGDADDHLFLKAKRWDEGNIPNWRSMSNNTITADSYDYLSNLFWEGYNGNGEPYGLFNLGLCQEYGRLKEKREDYDIQGLNPCGEIGLENGGVCNLSELFLPNISNKNELIDCAKLLYKTQKAICALNYLHERTTKIVHKNMRIGIGVGGICKSLDKIDWLDDCYKELRKFDKEWSNKREWPESIKLTTVKPSGTISLVSDVSPGVHPAYAKYYIRRVRMASNDRLVQICKDHGYNVEFQTNFDGSSDRNTIIVEFPCYAGENVKLAKDMTAVDQLELIKKIQTVWADNAVSCTIYYKKEELPEIKKWLEKHFDNSIKSVSFLLHKQEDHGFIQPPYEEITQEKYSEMTKNLKSFSYFKTENQTLDGLEVCVGACPIR